MQSDRKLDLDRHIVLYQPWASLIASGRLPVLIRKRGTNIRGWVGIYTSSTFEDEALYSHSFSKKDFPLECVVGAVKVNGSHNVNNLPPEDFLEKAYGQDVRELYPPKFLPSSRDPYSFWRFSKCGLAVDPLDLSREYARSWIKEDVEITLDEVFDVPKPDLSGIEVDPE